MDKIQSLLQEIRPEFDFSTSENFIEDGMLDSFDVVSLVSEIEDTFNISIDALDIIPESFCSILAIANTIKKNGGKI